MLSTFSKNGLTVTILGWDAYRNSSNELDSRLVAEIEYQGEKRTDIIEGPILSYISKKADEVALEKSGGNSPQGVKPHLYYAELYYDIIV